MVERSERSGGGPAKLMVVEVKSRENHALERES